MWLIQDEVGRKLERAAKADVRPGAQEQARFEEQQLAAQSDGLPRGMAIAGDTAEIAVQGVLTKKPDLFARIFGGGNTAYEQIDAAINYARTDPRVRKVRFAVDSPGGMVDGLFNTLAAIEVLRSEKPVSVVASKATSAAYAIAATAGRIEATGPAAEFGSVGVVASFLTFEDLKVFTNTESPDKAPDPKTEEGKRVIQSHLDAYFDLLVDAIARGRGIDKQSVIENYGRGAVVLANEAKKRGMVDRVVRPAMRVVRGAGAQSEDAPGGDEPDSDPAPAASSAPAHSDPSPAEPQQPAQEESANLRVVTDASTDHAAARGESETKEQGKMDLRELKAKHPELCDQLRAEGRDKERDRVNGHLTLGEKCGDLKTAFAAIRDGSELTQTLQATYMAAALNRRDQESRQQDEGAAARAADQADPPSEAQRDLGDIAAEAAFGEDVVRAAQGVQ